jgi:hypothetical protein
MPKKWPASVDLQASKESKGLQEQQSHLDSSTPLPRILMISSDSIGEGTSRHAPRSPRWDEKRGINSIYRRKDPIEGQNSQKPGLGHLAVPAAPGAIADNFLFAEDLHRVVFRERRLGALPLQIDIVPTLGARKHNSVRFTHNPS